MGNRPEQWILDECRQPRPATLLEWVAWFGKIENRRVAQTEIAPGISVSTVFLGIDHNHLDEGPPILFETMTFDDYEGGEMHRYATWSEAMCGHIDIVDKLQAKLVELQQATL